MKLRGLVVEDFLQYKKPCLFLIMPYCTFKCDRENGSQICQNWSLCKEAVVEMPEQQLVQLYLSNPITTSVVFGGLEPLDSFDEVLSFVKLLRERCEDDVVIYTGYTEKEVEDQVQQLQHYSNIIVKFGRFRPDQNPHLDPVLGIELASDNQYAKKIS